MKKIFYSLLILIVIICATFFGYRLLQVHQINMQSTILQYLDWTNGSTTPLHMAVVMADVDRVKTLLSSDNPVHKNPGTVNSKDGARHYPLYYVGQYRPTFLDYIYGRPDIKIAELLIKNGADVNANNGEAIDLALRTPVSNIEFVKFLLQNDFSLKNTFALHEAAMNGHLQVVKLLINHGADVNERVKGKTPLEATQQLPSRLHKNNNAIINELKKAGAKE